MRKVLGYLDGHALGPTPLASADEIPVKTVIIHLKLLHLIEGTAPVQFIYHQPASDYSRWYGNTSGT